MFLCLSPISPISPGCPKRRTRKRGACASRIVQGIAWLRAQSSALTTGAAAQLPGPRWISRLIAADFWLFAVGLVLALSTGAVTFFLLPWQGIANVFGTACLVGASLISLSIGGFFALVALGFVLEELFNVSASSTSTPAIVANTPVDDPSEHASDHDQPIAPGEPS